MNKEYLIAFNYNGHHGSLNGIYVVNKEDYEKIQQLQEDNESVYFHGIEGKHSEVELDADLFYTISDKEDEIESFKKMFGSTFGSYKPLDYFLEKYDELYYEEDEEE